MTLPPLRELLSVLEAGERATARPWQWEPATVEEGEPRYQHIMAVGMENPNVGDGIADTYHAPDLVIETGPFAGYRPPRDGRPQDATFITASANVATRWARVFVEMWAEQRDNYCDACWVDVAHVVGVEHCPHCQARAYLAQHPEEQA